MSSGIVERLTRHHKGYARESVFDRRIGRIGAMRASALTTSSRPSTWASGATRSWPRIVVIQSLGVRAKWRSALRRVMPKSQARVSSRWRNCGNPTCRRGVIRAPERTALCGATPDVDRSRRCNWLWTLFRACVQASRNGSRRESAMNDLKPVNASESPSPSPARGCLPLCAHLPVTAFL